jgi:hypothetical protein
MQFAVLENGFMKSRMRFDHRIFAGPIHADDIDPLSIVAKERGECFHIMVIPGRFVACNNLANSLFIRAVHNLPRLSYCGFV